MEGKFVFTLTVYGCVIMFELNCLRVKASSIACSVKCVIASTVYSRVITYEVSCLRVTTFQCELQCKVCCHCNCYSTLNLVCYGSRAQLSACYRFRCYRLYKYVITSTLN